MRLATFLERLEKVPPSRRVLILAATLLLMGGAYIFLFYLPLRGEIHNVRQELGRLDLQLKHARVRKANLARFEAEAAETEAQFHKALKLLPNKREIPSLLRTITQLGSDSGLEFRLFSPKPEVSRDFYVEIPVAVEVSGKYHDVAAFFDKIGRMERIVSIPDVSMRPSRPLSTYLITKCDLVTYRFKERDEETDREGEKRVSKKS